jgi:hypothetical protein
MNSHKVRKDDVDRWYDTATKHRHLHVGTTARPSEWTKWIPGTERQDNEFESEAFDDPKIFRFTNERTGGIQPVEVKPGGLVRIGFNEEDPVYVNNPERFVYPEFSDKLARRLVKQGAKTEEVAEMYRKWSSHVKIPEGHVAPDFRDLDALRQASYTQKIPIAGNRVATVRYTPSRVSVHNGEDHPYVQDFKDANDAQAYLEKLYADANGMTGLTRRMLRKDLLPDEVLDLPKFHRQTKERYEMERGQIGSRRLDTEYNKELEALQKQYLQKWTGPDRFGYEHAKRDLDETYDVMRQIYEREVKPSERSKYLKDIYQRTDLLHARLPGERLVQHQMKWGPESDYRSEVTKSRSDGQSSLGTVSRERVP